MFHGENFATGDKGKTYKEKSKMIYKTASELIGNTPLLELSNIERKYNINAEILAKLEYLNPTGSAKDRAALMMILDAEADGRLKRGSVIIEPTSGNTGIALASIAASRGYRTIIVMPDSMSEERQILMKAYGAELVLTDGKKGMSGAIAKAEELRAEIPGSFIPDQFSNPSNPKAHMLTTGPEILRDTDGKLDFLVAGVGTGGTISGTGKFLKKNIPGLKVVAVEPEDSPVLSKGYSGSHGIQGIGAGFIPKALDVNVYDKVITVSNDDAYKAGRILGNEEGILCGISSGAALHVAIELAKNEGEGKRIAVILPDSGDRYLSTPMFR